MTLPKRLENKRNELAEAYAQRIAYDEGFPSHMIDGLATDYKNAFDSACNLLLPEIEKMREALKLIAATQCDYEVFKSETNERLIECIIADTDCARDALASIEEFFNET